MAKENDRFLKKEELRFWIAIIGIFVSGAIAFTNLKAQVKANGVETGRLQEAIIRIDENLEAITKNHGELTNLYTKEVTEIKKDIQTLLNNQ